MRHITWNFAKALYKEHSNTTLAMKRPPQPMPGRSTPTRIAWMIAIGHGSEVTTTVNPNWSPNSDSPELIKRLVPKTVSTHCYVGKPTKYRALEALKLLRANKLQRHVHKFWLIEFDAGGVLAFVQQDKTGRKLSWNSFAYTAYHPHAAGADIAQSFAKPYFLKRVGGLSVYSHARKLSVEKLDAYYEWYEKTFGKRLRRPKQKAQEISVGDDE